MKRIVLLVAVLSSLALGACKQGKGDRCQVQDDCQDGLVCNQATNTCQDTAGGQIDALPPDGLPGSDAAIDAAPPADSSGPLG